MGSHKHLKEEWVKIQKENLICKLSEGEFYGQEFKGLNDEWRINTAKINDLKDDIEKVNKRPKVRHKGSMSELQGLALGVIEGAISWSAFLWFSLKLASGNGVDLKALALSGGLVGWMICNVINKICYENKPLSNAFNDYLVKRKEKKINKINKENQDIEFIQKMLACHDEVDVLSDEHMCIEEIER